MSTFAFVRVGSETQSASVSCSRFRRALCILLMLLTCATADTATAGVYHYRGYSSYSRWNRMVAAAARAQRAQLISSLQHQVADAKSVLKEATSNELTSEADLKAAMSRLDAARDKVEASHTTTKDAGKTLRNIEQELLRDPKVNHAYIAAQREALGKESILVKVIQQVLNLPAEYVAVNPGRQKMLAGLSSSQLEALKSDPRYVTADSDWRSAVTAVSKVRVELLESDADWQDAHKELLAAQQHEKSVQKERSVAGHTAAAQKNRTQSLQYIAMNAQNVINQGEMRLRQLGSHP